MIYEIYSEGMDGDLYWVEDHDDLDAAIEEANVLARSNGYTVFVLEEDEDDPYDNYLYSTEEEE